MPEAGELPQQAAIVLDVHISTIYCLQNRFKTTDTTDDPSRSGRPRFTTAVQDCYIFCNSTGRIPIRLPLTHPGTQLATWETVQCSYNPTKADRKRSNHAGVYLNGSFSTAWTVCSWPKITSTGIIGTGIESSSLMKRSFMWIMWWLHVNLA